MEKQKQLWTHVLMLGFSVICEMFLNEKEFKIMLVHLLFLHFLVAL